MSLQIDLCMELLSFLKIAAKSDTATYTKFLQQYSNQGNTIHIFHEGKDDPSFYANYIYSFVKKKQKVYFHQSSNKNGVYENYKKINWASYSKKRILFLVDKDFSDILKIKYPIDSNIFVTKYYSIENYLVTKSMFSRCLRELVGVSDEVINRKISRIFNDTLKEFYKASLLLTAYILLHKNRNNKINLSNISLADVFEVTKDFKVKRKAKIIRSLDRLCGVTTLNSYRELKSIVLLLSKINMPKKYTRGKFELMYFVKCFSNVTDLLNTGKGTGEKKYKCSINLSNGTAMQILGPRLKIPTDIKSFFVKSLK